MLYILYGKDTFRRSEALSKIRADLDRDGHLANNTVRFDKSEARSLSPNELRSACQTASFFDEGRLVIIEGLQARFGGAGRPGRRASAGAPSEAESFAEVLTNLAPTTSVVLIDESSGEFLQSLQKRAVDLGSVTVLQFNQKKADEVRQWAVERAKERGISFAPAALNKLLTLIDGAHLGELATEMDKLATYALGRTITAADVDALTSSALDTMPWHILDPIIEGRPDRAIRAIQAADDQDFHPMVVMAMVRNALRRLLLIQDMLREGISQAEIGDRLNMKGFPLQKATENVGRFRAERLETAYRLMLRADSDVKTGVMPVETVLPALIVELAELQRSQPGRPAARGAYR